MMIKVGNNIALDHRNIRSIAYYKVMPEPVKRSILQFITGESGKERLPLIPKPTQYYLSVTVQFEHEGVMTIRLDPNDNKKIIERAFNMLVGEVNTENRRKS
jgi:hypothetical protein